MFGLLRLREEDEPPPSDTNLLERFFLHGDESVLPALIRSAMRTAYGAARDFAESYLIAFNQQDYEDHVMMVVGELFGDNAREFRKLRARTGPGFGAWISVTSKRLLIDRLRSADYKKQSSTTLASAMNSGATEGNCPDIGDLLTRILRVDSGGPEAGSDMDLESARRALRAAIIGDLEPVEKLVMVEWLKDDSTYVEAAARLGMPLGTYCTLLKNARAKLVAKVRLRLKLTNAS